tara:strand:+ start:1547 stop:2260 length:714 start_codon:yes stop_codon:yes gene_type:complete
MRAQLTQINNEGQALQSGLDVFISIPVYEGQHLAYGDSFIASTLSSAPDYASSAVDYATEVIATAPATTANVWYKYHTESTSYPTITAPSTSINTLSMLGVFSAATSSHSGIYQKLSGLVTGNEYQVTVNFHEDSLAGSLSFSRFFYANQNYSTAIQTSVTVHTLPTPQLTFSFVAESICDVVFFDYSTTEVSAGCDISSIKIQEKNNYQIPVVTVVSGSISKVLRRKGNDDIEDDE